VSARYARYLDIIPSLLPKIKGHHGHPGAIAGHISHSSANKTMLGLGISPPSRAALPKLRLYERRGDAQSAVELRQLASERWSRHFSGDPVGLRVGAPHRLAQARKAPPHRGPPGPLFKHLPANQRRHQLAAW
jgi:hypothetical protein